MNRKSFLNFILKSLSVTTVLNIDSLLNLSVDASQYVLVRKFFIKSSPTKPSFEFQAFHNHFSQTIDLAKVTQFHNDLKKKGKIIRIKKEVADDEFIVAISFQSKRDIQEYLKVIPTFLINEENFLKSQYAVKNYLSLA